MHFGFTHSSVNTANSRVGVSFESSPSTTFLLPVTRSEHPHSLQTSLFIMLSSFTLRHKKRAVFFALSGLCFHVTIIRYFSGHYLPPDGHGTDAPVTLQNSTLHIPLSYRSFQAAYSSIARYRLVYSVCSNFNLSPSFLIQITTGIGSHILIFPSS